MDRTNLFSDYKSFSAIVHCLLSRSFKWLPDENKIYSFLIEPGRLKIYMFALSGRAISNWCYENSSLKIFWQMILHVLFQYEVIECRVRFHHWYSSELSGGFISGGKSSSFHNIVEGFTDFSNVTFIHDKAIKICCENLYSMSHSK